MTVPTFVLKAQRRSKSHILDHAKGATWSDSCYVFRALARRFLVFDLAVWERFVLLTIFCFKTPAAIKILRRDTTFCCLAAVALQLRFLRQRDLETAQNTIS